MCSSEWTLDENALISSLADLKIHVLNSLIYTKFTYHPNTPLQYFKENMIIEGTPSISTLSPSLPPPTCKILLFLEARSPAQPAWLKPSTSYYSPHLLNKPHMTLIQDNFGTSKVNVRIYKLLNKSGMSLWYGRSWAHLVQGAGSLSHLTNKYRQTLKPCYQNFQPLLYHSTQLTGHKIEQDSHWQFKSKLAWMPFFLQHFSIR